jgi:hypothetical protein
MKENGLAERVERRDEEDRTQGFGWKDRKEETTSSFSRINQLLGVY